MSSEKQNIKIEAELIRFYFFVLFYCHAGGGFRLTAFGWVQFSASRSRSTRVARELCR